jgi:hypothetical protein
VSPEFCGGMAAIRGGLKPSQAIWPSPLVSSALQRRSVTRMTGYDSLEMRRIMSDNYEKLADLRKTLDAMLGII